MLSRAFYFKRIADMIKLISVFNHYLILYFTNNYRGAVPEGDHVVQEGGPGVRGN